jgi:IS30 family transposase
MAHNFTLEEREVISQMWSQDASYQKIGEFLGRDPTSIGREVRRNSCGGQYWASQAHELARRRRCQARAKSAKMTRPEIATYVQQKLTVNWSPEQIAGRMPLDFPDNPRLRISHQTIYTWLKRDDHGRRWRRHLRRFRLTSRRRRSAEQASRSVRNRPEVINRRERFGDWEGDTIVGLRHGGPVLVSMVERLSGYLELCWVADAKSATVTRALVNRMGSYPADLRHSATFDNGSEFSQAATLEEKLQLSVYFADPRSPYQRGTNENTNGLVRQYFPKGTSLHDVSRYKVAQTQDLLNHRPRKRHGFLTPQEVLIENRHHATPTLARH